MLKKIILSISVAVVLIIAAPTKAQAAFPDGDAVGAMLMGGWPVGGAIGVTGQSSKVPVMFGGTVRFGVGHFGVGFTADWWGFKHNFGPAGDSDAWVYLGPGGAFTVDFGSGGYWFLTAGLRMPVGFSFIVKKNWEIFIEIAPTVNVVAVGNSGFYVFGARIGDGGGFWLPGLLGFGGEFGFRYWF